MNFLRTLLCSQADLRLKLKNNTLLGLRIDSFPGLSITQLFLSLMYVITAKSTDFLIISISPWLN